MRGKKNRTIPRKKANSSRKRPADHRQRRPDVQRWKPTKIPKNRKASTAEKKNADARKKKKRGGKMGGEMPKCEYISQGGDEERTADGLYKKKKGLGGTWRERGPIYLRDKKKEIQCLGCSFKKEEILPWSIGEAGKKVYAGKK